MFQEHTNVIWGTECRRCGTPCGMLQKKHHPWDKTTFKIEISCPQCGYLNVVDQETAAEYYNHRIYSYFQSIHGTVLDLGCGGGFLSGFLLADSQVKKVYGLDQDKECINDLADLTQNEKFRFFLADVRQLNNLFAESSLDFLVSRDVFMFISDTDRYFDDVTKQVNGGIRQMGWFMKDNQRMKNQLRPEQIADEYRKRGWSIHLESLDWYKSGYFIRADREDHCSHKYNNLP